MHSEPSSAWSLGAKTEASVFEYDLRCQLAVTGCQGFYATHSASTASLLSTPEGQGILRSFVRELPEISQRGKIESG